MRYISYFEIFFNLGMGVGPGIGGYLYPIFGYSTTMYIFGASFWPAIYLAYKWIPSELNTAPLEEVEKEENSN